MVVVEYFDDKEKLVVVVAVVGSYNLTF